MTLILANQPPDFAADQAVGKRNRVVRGSRLRTAPFYRLTVGSSYYFVVAGVLFGHVRSIALLCLLSLPVGMVASRSIARAHTAPPKFQLSIILPLVSAHLFSILLILSFITERLKKSLS